MKEGHISFKFKSENKLDTVKFHGESIFIKDLKGLIAEARKLGQINSELIIYDERSNEVFENDKKISTNCVVIVERRTPEMSLEDKMYVMSDILEERKSNGKCPFCNDNFKQPITTTCCERQACKACKNNIFSHFLNNAKKGYENQSKNQKGRCVFCNSFPKSNQFMHNNNKNMETGGGGYRPPYKPYPPYNHPQHPPPIPADLADILNNAKYFIIKSGNLDNIDLARKYSKWATTLPNQRKLNEAFTTTPNVLLIFSVNKSSKFQGFARMESLISNDQTSPFWKDTGYYWNSFYYNNMFFGFKENIKLGGSFKIKWLRYSDLSFNKIAHLRNRFNNNEPIKKSRDTQEIPLEIGREICSHFENTDGHLNKSTEEETAPYMNFDIQDNNPTVKIPTITAVPPNQNVTTVKNNEEDYDDVDRFMLENNLGIDHFNDIKDLILNQSKEEELSVKATPEDTQSVSKKQDDKKELSQKVESSDEAKVEQKEEKVGNISQAVLDDKTEGKQDDPKIDRNAIPKMPGQMGAYYRRNGAMYPPNYMYYYSMWNPYMNYYGNNPNAMRMPPNYYYQNFMGANGQPTDMKKDEEKNSQDSDRRKRRGSSSREKERRKSKDRQKDKSSKYKDKKSRRDSKSRSRSRSKSRISSKSKKNGKKKNK